MNKADTRFEASRIVALLEDEAIVFTPPK